MIKQPKILIIYYSKSGNTKNMAEMIAQGIEREKVEVEIKDVKFVNMKNLFEYEGIIVGSPTYYGGMVADLKQLFEETIELHGRLDGKVGAAFSSSIQIGGGNETTILDILHAMMIHGMIVQGDSEGDHYGCTSIGSPDPRTNKECVRKGERIAQLVKRLFR